VFVAKGSLSEAKRSRHRHPQRPHPVAELWPCQAVFRDNFTAHVASIRRLNTLFLSYRRLIEPIEHTYVVYSKPTLSYPHCTADAKQEEKKEPLFHNTAFVWHSDFGHVKLHSKCYFPEEDMFWEETVYDREAGGEGEDNFQAVTVGGLTLGVLLCADNFSESITNMPIVPMTHRMCERVRHGDVVCRACAKVRESRCGSAALPKSYWHPVTR
jgi:hypothetical protein